MAVIVPILMYVSGAAATVGAAIGISATMVSSVVGLALQVTGINNKINKAASKVFGEDLVSIVNIAGAVYGAVSSLGNAAGAVDGLSAATDASSAMAVNGMDLASETFKATGGVVSDGFSAMGGGTIDASSIWATNGMDAADNTFNLAQQASPVGLASDGYGVNILAPEAGTKVDTKFVANSTSLAADELANRSQGTSASFQSGATGQTAAGQDASAMKASSGQHLKAGDITKGVVAPKTPVVNTLATKPGSFFDKLLSSDKALGAVVQGVGGAISSSAASKSQKEALDFAKRKYHSVSGVRVA